MKSILTLFVATVFLSGIMAAASAADVIDLSTIDKMDKTANTNTITLPQLSLSMPTIAPTALGGNTKSNVMDLSTLGKKVETTISATKIKSASPITITPMFAVKNPNTSEIGGTVFTLPQAVSSVANVYTFPIELFGGA